jgi:hypothetical protein
VAGVEGEGPAGDDGGSEGAQVVGDRAGGDPVEAGEFGLRAVDDDQVAAMAAVVGDDRVDEPLGRAGTAARPQSGRFALINNVINNPGPASTVARRWWTEKPR